jgi:serine/threonine protein kinase
VKACPQCKKQFADTDDYCPEHGAKLYELSVAVEQRASAGGQPQIVVRQRDPLLGQNLDGRYTLEEKLGEGGMGVVYRAQHAVIEKTVAVKVLRREMSRDASQVQRFLQEAKAASRIGHPNIVDVNDFGTLPDGSAYFVMEYINGATLSRVLKDEKMLPVTRALPIVVQLARALSAAHDKGVVHRDLKPENIFLIERDGRRDFVKIVDFGIAKMAPTEGGMQKSGPRLTRVGSVFGTPEYMAPEQAAGRTDTDHRVDIYALGTIFYEMVVGHVPHRGETLVATIAMQMLDPIVPPHEARPHLDLEAPLEEVIMKALAKEREARYESMFEFLTALEHAAGGIPLDPMASSSSVRIPLASLVPNATIRATPDAATLAPPAAPPKPPRINPALIATAPAMQAPTLIPKNPRPPTNEPPPAADEPIALTRRKDPSTGPGGLSMVGMMIGEAPPPVMPGNRSSGRRLLWAAAIVALLAGGGVAVAVMAARKNNDAGAAAGTTSAQPSDNPAVKPDSGILAAARTIDAAPAAIKSSTTIDAGVLAVESKPDAGMKATVIKPNVPPPVPKKKISIVVHTNPAGGELTYVRDGAHVHISDGATIEYEEGKSLNITCTAASADPGHVAITFDAKTPHDVTCTMTVYHCTPGIKDPIHDCPG